MVSAEGISEHDLAVAQAQLEDTRAMVEPDEALALIAEIRRLRSLLVDKPKHLTLAVRGFSLKVDCGLEAIPSGLWMTYRPSGVNTVEINGIVDGTMSYTIHPSELGRARLVRVTLEPVE